MTAKVSYWETYPYLMRDWWQARAGGGNVTIWPWADGSLLIQQVLDRYKKFRFYFGDARLEVCLLMVGLVDCAPRPLYGLGQVHSCTDQRRDKFVIG